MSGKKRLLIVVFGVAVIVILVGGGFAAYKHFHKLTNNANNVAPPPAERAIEGTALAQKQRAQAETDPLKQIGARMTYSSYLNTTGKKQDALNELLDIERTYPQVLLQRSGVYGQIWGMYKDASDTKKADEYKKKYIDGLNATGQSALAQQVQSQSSGVQR